MIKKGDKIKDNRSDSIHIVESIDVYENIVLVFTEDVKYIPIEFCEFVPKSIIAEYFMSLFFNKKCNIPESKINEILQKHNVVQIAEVNEEYIDFLIKKHSK